MLKLHANMYCFQQGDEACSSLFHDGSKINHSCLPNCAWMISHDNVLSIVTLQSVAAGEDNDLLLR